MVWGTLTSVRYCFGGEGMWPRILVVAALLLSGCASERIAESNAPDLSFQGPLRPVNLSSAQIKLVQQGIAASLKDGASARFGGSYKAAISANSEIVVCGYVNGERFAGMFAKPVNGSTEFLAIGVAISQEEEDAVKTYCRTDGIYVPR
jgi:hypothetical protein